MRDRGQLIRHAASFGSLQIVAMGLGFLIGILLARQLGPADYGVYGFAMAIAAISGAIIELGLPILGMREFSRAQESRNWASVKGLIAWSSLAMLLTGAVAMAVMLVIDPPGAIEDRRIALLAIAIAILLGQTKLRAHALLALGRIATSQLANLVVRPAMFAALLLFVLYSGRNLTATLALETQILAAAVALIVAIVMFRTAQPTEYTRAKWSARPREWLGTSVPMGMTEGIRLVQGQMSLLLLGVLSVPSEVGYYKVAESTVLVCLMAMVVVNTVAGPHFARLHSAGRIAELQRMVNLCTLAMAGSLAVLTAIFLFFGEPLLVLAFGPQFAASHEPLMVLLAGWTAAAMLGPGIVLCNMTGFERWVTGASIAAVVCQLVLAFLLIPEYGGSGAALGVVAGQLVLLGTLAVVARRKLGVDPVLLTGWWHLRNLAEDRPA